MLQRLLEMATENGDLTPLRGRHAKLRLSLYVDDAAVFIHPKQEEVAALMTIMEKFGEATGLQINPQKCAVLPIRCQDVSLEHVLAPFAGKQASFPTTYLGLPLTIGQLRLVHLQPVLDKA